jgi:APA family basic amino acid/polyamine antiporter
MQLLQRKLGLADSSAIVVGTVIGTGVFLKTASMAQDAGTPGYVLLAWILAGVMSLAGALTYAEISSLFPDAGGEYVFLREGYGPSLAFLYGWTRFWIVTPGAIAAYAMGAASFLSGCVSLTGMQQLAIAVTLILLFTLINCFAVSFGGGVQSFMTALKVLLIGGLILGLLSTEHQSISAAGEFHGWSRFGLAVLAALWAFDGWNNLPMVAGEIKNPSRVIPRALVGGMFLVLVIYMLANYAYFLSLPFSEILTANSTLHPEGLPVATMAAQSLIGPRAIQILSIAFVLSAVGAMNGSILSGARVPFAMASDGLLFKILAKINSKTHVPVTAVVIQGLWACPIALSGTFDQITDCVVFASWIFYALVGFSLFRFRAQGRKTEYRTPGYPFTPILFILSSLVLLTNTLFSAPKSSLMGIGFIALGLPVYFIYKKRLQPQQK